MTSPYVFAGIQGAIGACLIAAMIRALLARVAPGGALLIGNHNAGYVDMRLFDWLVRSGLAVGFFRGDEEILWSTKSADPASATAVIFRGSSG